MAVRLGCFLAAFSAPKEFLTLGEIFPGGGIEGECGVGCVRTVGKNDYFKKIKIKKILYPLHQ